MKNKIFALVCAVLTAVFSVLPVSAEGAPATNDSANMTLWWIILAACAALIVVVLVIGKKRKH